VTSPPPGYRGYLPDDGLAARPEGFSEIATQPVVAELDPDDPLINPAAAGLGGWSRRVRVVIAANWRPLAAIAAVCYALPVTLAAVIPARFGPLLLSLLVSVTLQAVGWGASVWAITQWATGVPPSLGGALAYGFRRGPLLVGLNLLASLLVGVGTVALVIPGLYLWFATSLVMPAAVFRQEQPVGASFGLFHRFPGAVLARVGLAAGPALLLRITLVVITLAGGGGAGFTLATLAGRLVIGMPLYVLAIVGAAVTHVEMTARTAPITSASLLAAL